MNPEDHKRYEKLLALLKEDKPRKETHATLFGSDPIKGPFIYSWPRVDIADYGNYHITTISEVGSVTAPNDDTEKFIELALKRTVQNIICLKQMDFDGKLWILIELWIKENGRAHIVCTDPDLMDVAQMMFDIRADYYESTEDALKAILAKE